MATSRDTSTRASREIEFALDRLEVEDDRIVVEGRWFGVLGRRFVRPVLQIEGRRRLIAVMDHKPWPAEEGVPWTAAFAHSGESGPSRLQVAPDIVVELPAPGAKIKNGMLLPARVVRRTGRFPRQAPPPEPAPRVEAAAGSEREKDPSAAARERAKVDSAERLGEELERARADGERLREDLEVARTEGERLRGDLEKAKGEATALRAELGDLQTELERARTQAERMRSERDEARAGLAAAPAPGDDAELAAARERIARLKAEGERARAAGGRALTERDRAREELEALRRAAAPPPGPVVMPRPLSVRERRDHHSWGIRALAVGTLAVLAYLFVDFVTTVL